MRRRSARVRAREESREALEAQPPAAKKSKAKKAKKVEKVEKVKKPAKNIEEKIQLYNDTKSNPLFREVGGHIFSLPGKAFFKMPPIPDPPGPFSLPDSEDDEEKITKTLAMGQYGLNESHLAKLSPPTVKPNPHYRSAAPMRLYKLDQVQAMSQHVQQEKERQDHLKRHTKFQEKVNQLLKKNVHEWQVAPEFKSFVFGGTTVEQLVENQITKIKRRFDGAIRVQTYLCKPLWKISLARAFANKSFEKKLRNKDTALRACVQVLNQSKLWNAVLHQPTVLSRIRDFLHILDVRQLASAYPGSQIQREIQIISNPQALQQVIMEQTKKHLGTNIDLKKPQVQEIIQRTIHDPDHIEYGRAEITNLIHDVAVLNKQQRKEKLNDALQAHNIRLRDDSRLCKLYIDNGTPAINYVVAVMRITAHLFSFGHEYWSKNRHKFEAALVEKVNKKVGNFQQVCNILIKEKSVRQPTYHHRRRWG